MWQKINIFQTSQAAVSIASMQTIEEGLKQKRRLRSVASVWGAESVQFLAALAVLPRSISKKQLNSAGLFEKNG